MMLYGEVVGPSLTTGNPYIIGAAVVVELLGTLFGVLGGGGDVKALDQKVNQLRDTMARAVDITKRLAWSASRLALFGIFAVWRVINDGLKEIAKVLRSIIDALKKLYGGVIAPALRALRQLRKILNDLYIKWLRPIINIIQKVRQVLAIFRAFGFKWASVLDARLARLEGKIIGPFIWLTRQLNGLGGWLNVILTAGGIIQKTLFINSAYSTLGALTNLLWVGQSGQLAGSPFIPPATQLQPATLPQVQGQMQQYALTQTGPLALAAQQALIAARSVAIAA